MSPAATIAATTFGCFPRVSGDEPAQGSNGLAVQVFSPRERG